MHPTPESWRVALCTAFGATAITAVGLWVAFLFAGTPALLAGGVLVALAGIATVLPAIGALSATIDADANGVTISRFGRASRYAWDKIVDVQIVVRRANVPDGTEYHWVVPNRRTHVVAVPSLALEDGRVREIPALAGPAEGPRRGAATENLAVLMRVRALQSVPRGEQPVGAENAAMRSHAQAVSSPAGG